jgi:tRNA (cmo5U34)-methyltransferase
VFVISYSDHFTGGSLWISDLIAHDDPTVQAVMWQRYGEYLTQLKGEAYRDQVFGYIEQEDTPRPLLYQLHLLKTVGFRSIEVLHKHTMFAAFGGISRPIAKRSVKFVIAAATSGGCCLRYSAVSC